MNVKVVLFPEGEDPDSYSKSVGTSELETYLKEHTQDFISFKADILLKDDENDPIKRAELIRDIVQSVSLIPDQITRNVYMQTIAQRFDMSEEVLANELIKLRQNAASKQRFTKTEPRKETPIQSTSASSDDPYAHEPNPMQEEAVSTQPEIVTGFDHNEYDLMRILVQYGPLGLNLKQRNEQGEEEEFETSITELICHELDIDELVFDNPLFAKMHQIITDSLAEKVLLKSSYFQRLEDQNIVKFVSEIEMNEVEISHNWITKHNIYTNSEKDNLHKAVMGSIFSFKVSKVEKRIGEIRNSLTKNSADLDDESLMDLLSEQVALEKVKRIIAEKLGRIVMR